VMQTASARCQSFGWEHAPLTIDLRAGGIEQGLSSSGAEVEGHLPADGDYTLPR